MCEEKGMICGVHEGTIVCSSISLVRIMLFSLISLVDVGGEINPRIYIWTAGTAKY
jgi:uncharacterized protein YsxB (DUF464 family)